MGGRGLAYRWVPTECFIVFWVIESYANTEANRRVERVVLQVQTRLKPGLRSLGPLYPINSNSLILYEAVEDGFHLIENPNGLVPVVVNPDFRLPIGDSRSAHSTRILPPSTKVAP